VVATLHLVRARALPGLGRVPRAQAGGRDPRAQAGGPVTSGRQPSVPAASDHEPAATGQFERLSGFAH